MGGRRREIETIDGDWPSKESDQPSRNDRDSGHDPVVASGTRRRTLGLQQAPESRWTAARSEEIVLCFSPRILSASAAKRPFLPAKALRVSSTNGDRVMMFTSCCRGIA